MTEGGTNVDREGIPPTSKVEQLARHVQFVYKMLHEKNVDIPRHPDFAKHFPLLLLKRASARQNDEVSLARKLLWKLMLTS